MDWHLDKDKPICPQICEKLCTMIAKGEFSPNEKLLSVRDIALNAGVNPNTVQKSFEQLEKAELIYSVRGSGWYVKDNIDIAKQTLDRIIKEKTEEYFEAMKNLGFDTEKTKEYIKEYKYE